MTRRISLGVIPAVVLSALMTLAWPAHAEDAAGRGEKVVEQWCRMCHQRLTDKRDPDMAPPYEEIVQRPGRDEAYFTQFLKDDHFPMTIYRLFDNEKADVVAYLMSLKRKRTARP